MSKGRDSACCPFLLCTFQNPLLGWKRQSCVCGDMSGPCAVRQRLVDLRCHLTFLWARSCQAYRGLAGREGAGRSEVRHRWQAGVPLNSRRAPARGPIQRDAKGVRKNRTAPARGPVQRDAKGVRKDRTAPARRWPGRLGRRKNLLRPHRDRDAEAAGPARAGHFHLLCSWSTLRPGAGALCKTCHSECRVTSPEHTWATRRPWAGPAGSRGARRIQLWTEATCLSLEP